MSKCVVCDKEGAVKMAICDGYMDTATLDVCPDGICHREIAGNGIHSYITIDDLKKPNNKEET